MTTDIKQKARKEFKDLVLTGGTFTELGAEQCFQWLDTLISSVREETQRLSTPTS